MINIDEKFKLTQGQGQRSRSNMYLCNFCLGYKSLADEWILIIITLMIDNDEMFKLNQGEGHKVKGQGHICSYAKFLLRL